VRTNACKSALLHVSIISLVLVIGSAEAHESHDTQIQHLEKQLDHLPSNSFGESVALELHRADLYRRQRNWDAALHDYQQVAERDPDNIAMMLGRAQLHLDQQQYSQAKLWSTRVQRLQPDHTQGELQTARALAGIGDYAGASIMFDRAFKRFEQSRPEHYIEHVQLLVATGNPNAERHAVAILDKGAEALGHPISLHSVAVEIEKTSGQLNAALTRIGKVLASNGSLLNWRLQRSELLAELGRPIEALGDLHCVIHRIQQLPEHRRRSRAFQTLMQRTQDLEAQLNAINADTERPNKTAVVREC